MQTKRGSQSHIAVKTSRATPQLEKARVFVLRKKKIIKSSTQKPNTITKLAVVFHAWPVWDKQVPFALFQFHKKKKETAAGLALWRGAPVGSKKLIKPPVRNIGHHSESDTTAPRRFLSTQLPSRHLWPLFDEQARQACDDANNQSGIKNAQKEK